MTPFWFIVIGVGFGWLIHSGRFLKMITVITTPISFDQTSTEPPTVTNPPSNST